ncbi:MAG: hypothetical protein ABI877_03935 [Gemmatimonadaceae bacterium]
MKASIVAPNRFSLTIAGLVILVPDGKGVLHIIVPETTNLKMGHGEFRHDMPRHKIEIVSHRENKVKTRSLGGCLLDLTGLANEGDTSLKVKESVMSLADISGKKSLRLAKEFIDLGERDRRVAAHIKLRGGALTAVRTACFKAKEKQITKAVCLLEWSVTVASQHPELTLPVSALRSDIPHPDPIIVKRNEVFGSWLGVYNVEESIEISDPGDLYLPPLDFSADHVEAYWQFFADADGEPKECNDERLLHHPRICPLVRVAHS